MPEDHCSGEYHGSYWDRFWQSLTPEGEIRMWDFYGGDRPWILKHVPRHGKVLEAGCGLGRYVLYLSRLGIDIEGLDFHEPTVPALREWCSKRGIQSAFRWGDVTRLPYIDSSLAGYISLGVIEHFEEGPSIALDEAFRVLRPGGIAIISTPAVSFSQLYFRLRKFLKAGANRVRGLPPMREKFEQYWFTRHQLSAFVNESGLTVVMSSGCDLRYAFWEIVQDSIRRNFWFRLADLLERTPMRQWGACAIVIAVKMDEEMHCFLCGERNVSPERMVHYLPICEKCSSSKTAEHYATTRTPRFNGHCRYSPPVLTPNDEAKPCFFCEKPVRPDALFEYYGFAAPLCSACLQTPSRNIEASNNLLQGTWRSRKQ